MWSWGLAEEGRLGVDPNALRARRRTEESNRGNVEVRSVEAPGHKKNEQPRLFFSCYVLISHRTEESSRGSFEVHPAIKLRRIPSLTEPTPPPLLWPGAPGHEINLEQIMQPIALRARRRREESRRGSAEVVFFFITLKPRVE